MYILILASIQLEHGVFTNVMCRYFIFIIRSDQGTPTRSDVVR